MLTSQPVAEKKQKVKYLTTREECLVDEGNVPAKGSAKDTPRTMLWLQGNA